MRIQVAMRVFPLANTYVADPFSLTSQARKRILTYDY